MPGVGFDVVPSDCLARYLKDQLPEAVDLTLAFYGLGRISHGTQTTMTMNIGKGGAIRKNGKITPVPAAYMEQEIDFGDVKKVGVTIPWGDVSTAYYTTGIPNIKVFTVVPQKQITLLKTESLSRLAARDKSCSESAPESNSRGRAVFGRKRNRKGLSLGQGC